MLSTIADYWYRCLIVS